MRPETIMTTTRLNREMLEVYNHTLAKIGDYRAGQQRHPAQPMQQSSDNRSIVERVVQEVLRSESATVARLADQVNSQVAPAVETLLHCDGRVIVSGMGKMSAIARKMAATLCSTGTPAVFLHPSEALHGDLGIVTQHDVLLALSNSGETEEIIQLIPFMKRQGVPVISLTGSPNNALAELSDHAISLGVTQEADAITDAPTNSTIAALAMCDAMAVALVHLRGFSSEQFAIFHPGGHLGRKLLLRVDDVMHRGDKIPRIDPASTLRDAIVVISQKTLGAGFVVDSRDQLLGIITDGDLRRILERQNDPLELKVTDLMMTQPKTVSPTTLAAEALRLMEDCSITVLPVVVPAAELAGADEAVESVVVGALHLHDLLRVGLA